MERGKKVQAQRELQTRFLEMDIFEALEDQPLDTVFVAVDAQRLREAA